MPVRPLRPFLIIIFLQCLLCVCPVVSFAHSVSHIFGEGVLSGERLRMTLFVGVQDIAYAVDRESSLTDTMDGSLIRKGIEIMQRNLLAGMHIVPEDGPVLAGKVIATDVPTIADGPIRLIDLLKESFAFTLEYRFETKPTSLRFQQTYQNDASVIPVSVTVSLVMDERGADQKVSFWVGDANTIMTTVVVDWNAAVEEPIRVTTAATEPINAYLYIQNHEVRLEMVMALSTLESWMAIPRADAHVLEPSEQADAEAALSRFMKDQNRLQVDGKSETFVLSRIGFFAANESDFINQTERLQRAVRDTYLGVIMSCRVDAFPNMVELVWTLFNERVGTVRGLVFVGDESSRFLCSRDAPTIRWENTSRYAGPQVDAVCATDGKPDARTQRAILEELLNHVYRSFEFGAASAVYDALELNVHPDLLPEIFLKINRSLVIQQLGGGCGSCSCGIGTRC